MTFQKSPFIIDFSRVLVGLFFIFSGLIKINDPIGFGYKLQEYFEVFKLYSLVDFSTVISLILCAIEIILGISLLLGIYAKKTVLGLLLLILFFTVLTFSSAVFKIVTSCGCFGDAIPLTPWQSFAKDILLLILILILFFNKNNINPLIKNEKNTIVITAILSFLPGIYALSFEPFIDFLPYKIGANLPSLMTIPPGAPMDEHEITYHLLNKKSKEERDITDKAYLKQEIWRDTNWQIVGEPKQKLIKKGFQVQIKDLKIMSNGSDITEQLLHNPFPVFWLVSYQIDENNQEKIAELLLKLRAIEQQKKIRFVLMTAMNADNLLQEFSFLKNAEILFVDAVPLKSMIRTQPGVLLIQNGNVIQKWNYLTFPDADKLNKKYLQD